MADIQINSNPKSVDTVDQTAGQTQAVQTQQKQPGKFGKIIGAVAGGALNMIAPGAGLAISSLIGGGVPNMNGIGSDSMQYLQLQQRISNELRQFEALSSVMKARHDAAMSAIRNMH